MDLTSNTGDRKLMLGWQLLDELVQNHKAPRLWTMWTVMGEYVNFRADK